MSLTRARDLPGPPPAARRLPAPRRLTSQTALRLAATACALLLSAPLVSLLGSAVFADGDNWAHLSATVLGRFVANTLWLSLLVAAGVFLVGTGAAWLVTMCRFPGRRVFEWALVLPLALPAYVAAYAYSDFLQHPGPVQTLLRSVTGWGPKDYWFPEIRSLEGAALMLVLVLYPYVYLLARAAFLQQSASAIEASRSLGASPWRAFATVALPMTRPAIAAGVTLALMETLADFGTVAHFGVETFTTAIYRTWFSLGDRAGAVQLAMMLVGAVFLVLALERLERGDARFGDQRGGRPFASYRLAGWRAALAVAGCAGPIVLGFVVPVAVLVSLGARHADAVLTSRSLDLAANSLILASVGAGCAVAIATVVAYANRLSPGLLARAATRMAALGYAIPGAVIAVGLLVPLTSFENALDGWMRASLGVSTGLFLTGTIAALVFAYCVRFLAAALGAVEASLGKVTPSIDGAARTLGSGAGRTLVTIHLPMIRGGVLTAFLIVFVDIVKELPATLILRPFNFDTLAVQAYRYASDERLAQAALPSLMIACAGLLPVLLLSRQIARTRIAVAEPMSAPLAPGLAPPHPVAAPAPEAAAAPFAASDRLAA